MTCHTIRIDRARLIERMMESFATVNYRMGAKPPLGGMPGVNFTEADCSGYVRWLVYAASYGKTKMPRGSWYQRLWCESIGFKRTDYSNCGLNDSRLRIAFTNPKNGHAGHVWLVINRQSIESYGGNGAGRRPWYTPVLKDRVDHTFVLTEVLQ